MRFQIGAMSVGDILDRGLKLLLARLPTFYAINLIALLPIILLQLAMPLIQQQIATEAGGMAMGDLVAGGISFIVLLLVQLFIFQPIGNAAILHVIAQEFVDQRAGIGQAFRFAFHRFGRLLWASFLAGLLVGVGMLLCLVPGILFAIWYIFVGQVVVVEGRKGEKALSRSKSLTEGFRLRVMGVGMLIGLVAGLLNVPLGFLQAVYPSYEKVPVESAQQTFERVGKEIGGGSRSERSPLPGFQRQPPALQRQIPIYPNYYINFILTQLVQILAQTFGAICWTLFYFDLRIRKEGFDLELAAKQQTPEVT